MVLPVSYQFTITCVELNAAEVCCYKRLPDYLNEVAPVAVGRCKAGAVIAMVNAGGSVQAIEFVAVGEMVEAKAGTIVAVRTLGERKQIVMGGIWRYMRCVRANRDR